MNKKTLAGIAAGATLITGGAVDMVPRESFVMFAYQQTAGAQTSVEYRTATGTVLSVSKQPVYKDTDKNGKISVQVSVDRKGNLVFAQIDEATYESYNRKGAYLFAEKLTYYITPIEALAEATISEAEAAIALDSAPGSIPNCSPCTSLTWSHTVSGTDPVLVASGHTSGSVANPITGITYAGNAMTSVGAVKTTNNLWAVIYQKTGTTGANNIVISSSASISLLAGAVSYTGVDQSNPVDVHAGATLASTNVVQSLTTTVDNAWLVGAISGNRTLSAASGSTYRDSCCGYGLYDTNGPKTPAGTYSVGATQADTTTSAIYALALKPASAPAPSTIVPIIQPIISWW